ncbi:chitin-binding protein [Sphaerisporangium melleum]|uniref:Chitin-binding protein n=1 Tax=Sphaerisporangium melleum TaxID=321316 RepID=A0A917VI01_9ACTN|nr:lytic polysaccharide monooxygenase auxiliary activity family 9 protein [Sphaerisporangium melleum]GGK80397.1 chitin-binding protein [Sphaerisporangium melleum]GII72052.1 chitin-binding protein [Sphaerisporangium melleum]
MPQRQASLTRRWAVRAAALTTALVACLATWVTPAFAHGAVGDPANRNYSCQQRWGNDFQNPAMAQQDPMCWQAWQDNPLAMWNYMSLYRNGLAGQFSARIPDGQICSGGRAEGGLYKSMDTVGAWKTTDIGNSFTVKVNDQASHGADYLLVYVTRQGFDPTTQAIKWSDLQLITKTGRYSPGSSYTANVSTSGHTGRAVVLTIWQASHMDQAFFFCSDVNFVR